MAVFSSSSNSSSSASGRGVGEEDLEEYDRDVISACWPSVLKAASAAFATRVSFVFSFRKNDEIRTTWKYPLIVISTYNLDCSMS